MKLLIFLFYFSHTDTCLQKDTTTQYMFPCTWTYSGSKIIHKGWMVRKNGKVFTLEGEHKIVNSTSLFYVDGVEENKKK